MAFLAELGALTDELVAAVTATSPTSRPKHFKKYRESALRGIKDRSHLQTNQFAVDEQLRGLVERFAVVGRDALSDALRQRLDALSHHSTRWTPETLHLLLELSDQPVKKSKLDALESLRPPDEDPGPKLRWEDIAREDGWSHDRGIWKNVDFADSSEDEALIDSQSQASDVDDTSDSSVLEPGQRTVQDLVMPDDAQEREAQLQRIQESQKWRCQDAQPKDASGRPIKIPISELQVVREVLFLLNGLQTSLFGPDCTPVPKFQLPNVSWDTHRALINSFAEYGRILLPLRRFCQTPQEVHLVQSFQDSVCRCLRAFDRQIASIQARFVDLNEDTIVSAIALQEELRPHLAPLASLGDVVRRLQEERFAHAFRFLELLYDATCIAQLSGDGVTYEYLGEIFFDCFRIYIRPIRQWMEGGALTPGDKTFFVAEAPASVPLNQIWSSRFLLRKSEQGQLHAPRFLQPAVRKIFNTGKSIVVLKHLGRFQHPDDHPEVAMPEPALDFEAVCGSPDLAFAPFAELFHDAFDRWVQSKHLSTSSNLQTILFDSCRLWSSLDALQSIFFMSDGSLADGFTSTVFTNLDALNPIWTDRFTLTELAQEAWSPCPGLEPYRLSASVDAEHIFPAQPGRARSSVRNSLPGVRLTYRLAWPVQLIITKDTTAHYRSVFTFLLQLRRAASLLAGPIKSPPQTEAEAAYYGLRTRILWLTNTLQSYLATLVLAPQIARVRADLQAAEDVDAMIDVHSTFARRVAAEACLGPKLDPIRQCILDVLDLAIRLQDARARHENEQQQQQQQQQQRPSSFSTPTRAGKLRTTAPPDLYLSPREKEEQEEEEDNNTTTTNMLFGDETDASGTQDNKNDVAAHHHHHHHNRHESYPTTLAGIRADFDRHLRFIAGGLRGVARASTDAAAAKWDLLAEMLEMGIREGGSR